jgi:glycerol kinase
LARVKSVCIAIDLGSSAVKVSAIDQTLRIRSSYSAPYSTKRRGPKVEFNADVVHQKVSKLLDRASKNLAASGTKIDSVGITSQRSTVVFWTEDGILAPAISWQDRRAFDQVEALTDKQQKIERLTGLRLSPHYSASKIAWMLEKDRQVRQALKRKKLMVGSLATYIIWKLTDGQVYALDHTLGQRFQLMDIESLCWSRWLCNQFKVPIGLLPKLKNSFDDFGQLNLNNNRVPIKCCIGDMQASCLGMGFGRQHRLAIQYGSGAFIGLATGKKKVTCPRMLSSILFTKKSQRQFFLEGTVNSVGNLVEQTGRRLKVVKSRYSIPRPMLIAAKNGLGAPHWQANTNEMLFSPRPKTGSGRLTTKLISSAAACRLNEIIAWFKLYGLRPPNTAVVGGGLVKNRIFMQSQVDILNIKLLPTLAEQTALQGVARLIFGLGRAAATKSLPKRRASVKLDLMQPWQRVVRDAKILTSQPQIVGGLWTEKLALTRPLVIAHRGANRLAPENTMAAFELASECGVDGIEFDVQLSRSNTPTVFHDRTLERIAAVDQSISRLDDRQIFELSAGRFAGKSQHIPTLEQVLREAPKHLLLYIDIKDRQQNNRLWRETIRLIDKTRSIKRVCLCSFNHQAARRVKQERADLLIGAIVGDHQSHLIDFASFDVVSFKKTVLDKRQIFNQRIAGKIVFVWTVNRQDSARKWMGYDVDGVITDVPEKIAPPTHS